MSLKKLLAATALALFTAGGAFAAEPIKIGVYLPLTGQNAFGGQLELEGVQLAHKEQPTVLGRPVELVIVDNKSDKVEAANAVKRLTAKEKVTGIIGTYGSSLAMAGGEVAESAKTPVIGTSCTNPLVTQGKKYYFRACFIDPYQGAGAATYAIKNLKATKAAILKDVSNDYAVGLANFFNKSFLKQGGKVTANLNYNSGDQDFTAQLTNIKKANPDVIFAPGNYTESALIIKQARQLGMKTPFIGGDTWDMDAFLKVGGEAVEGAVFSTFFANDVPINKTSEAFLKAYRDEYKKEPPATAALGFDAYRVVLDAITRANSAEPQKIRDALAQTKGFEGAAGDITINADRDADKPAVFKQVKGGKFAFLSTVKP